MKMNLTKARCVVFLGMPVAAYVQSVEDDLLEDDGFSVEGDLLEDDLLEDDGFSVTETPQEASSVENFFGRYVSGSVGISQASSGGIERSLSALNIGIDAPLSERLRVVTRVGAVDYTNLYTQNLEFNPDPANPLPPTREVEISDNLAVVNEAFFQWEANDFMLLSAGRERISWGQFDQFSPAAFILPTNNVSTNLRGGKIDRIYPQDVARLSVFPTPNIEIQGYFFNGVRLDPSVEEAHRYEVFFRQNTGGGLAGIDGIALPDASELDQSALRASFFFDWGVFVLSSFKGYDVGGFGLIVNDSVLSNAATMMTPGVRDFEYAVGETRYGELDVLGFEMSIPYGRTSYKLELLSYEQNRRLDIDSCQNITFRPEYRDLCEGIIDNNAGSPNVLEKWNVLALGFDYKGENWNSSFQFINFATTPVGETAELLIEEQARIDGNDDLPNAVPVGSFIRSVGEEKTAYIGFVFGALSQGFGAGFLGGKTFAESFDIGGFIGSIDYFDTPAGISDGPYETDSANTVMQVGINYRF
jgi:hypothetical protein